MFKGRHFHGELILLCVRRYLVRRHGAPLGLVEIIRRFPWLHDVFADGSYAGHKFKDALRRIGKWTSG